VRWKRLHAWQPIGSADICTNLTRRTKDTADCGLDWRTAAISERFVTSAFMPETNGSSSTGTPIAAPFSITSSMPAGNPARSPTALTRINRGADWLSYPYMLVKPETTERMPESELRKLPTNDLSPAKNKEQELAPGRFDNLSLGAGP